MTNANNPFGGRVVGNLITGQFNSKSNKYVVLATDATAFGIGDFVKTVNGNSDGLPICTLATAGELVRGIVVGFEADFRYLNQDWRAANTQRVVHVIDDPLATFEIQVNGTLTTAQIGQNFNLSVGSVNTSTGQSATEVDLSSITSGYATLKILSLAQRSLNDLGLYSKVLCCFVEHELLNDSSNPVLSFNLFHYYGTGTAILPAGGVVEMINVGTADFTLYATTPIQGMFLELRAGSINGGKKITVDVANAAIKFYQSGVSGGVPTPTIYNYAQFATTGGYLRMCYWAPNIYYIIDSKDVTFGLY